MIDIILKNYISLKLKKIIDKKLLYKKPVLKQRRVSNC